MGNPKLRVAGGVLIAVGLGWLILALQMDVSVSSCDTNASRIEDFGERMDAVARSMRCLTEEFQGLRPQVINIGLLSEKNNSLLLAGLTVLAGVILLAVSFNRSRTNSETPEPIEGRGLTASANAWRETQASLQPEQYNDFLEAFRGTPEALLAVKHKRILQDWDALKKTEGATVEAFLTNDLFPAMKQRVRQFIADEAGNNSSLNELNQSLLHQEEVARVEQLWLDEAEKAERARREKQKSRRATIGIVVAVAVIAAIGVSPFILSTLEEQWAKEKQAEEIAAEATAEAEAAKAEAEAAKAEAAALVASKAEFDAAALEFGVRDGESFRECDVCPEMVLIPPGSFIMGSPENEDGRADGEDQRRVSVQAFAAGKYEVTWTEYEACVRAGACLQVLDDGFGKGSRPVTNVSKYNAKKYVAWLSAKTDKKYRLLSEAEWEYAARAGSTTAYWWGDGLRRNQANYGHLVFDWRTGSEGVADGADKWINTSPVGSFPPNPFGLNDMHGNVFEWAEDCYDPDSPKSFDGQPVSADQISNAVPCPASGGDRVARGGSWASDYRDLRSANRGLYDRDNLRETGFRVARTL